MTARAVLTVELRFEQDVVSARQRARQIAAYLGFNTHEQTSISTAVSEIVRNAFRYAGGGNVEFALGLDERPQMLIVRVTDRGPGIADLQSVLDGRYVSRTGMGLGINGSKRLSDKFEIESEPGRGTTVLFGKNLPARAGICFPTVFEGLAKELSQRGPRNAFDEVQEQNKELLQALDALQVRQAEVERLNAELAETNRGVVALYAELDDRAESLRKASEYKSRFLSDMTHELRTPLNAVISISRLLLDRMDGQLTDEQDRQVSLIQKSSTSLAEMVDDLLDLAKIEAGKVEVHAAEFAISETLATLRGIFRPLALDGNVSFTIDEPIGVQTICSDERKIQQILRNLISNALKFTVEGSVTVKTTATVDSTVEFIVEDTGVGISPTDLERIFEDFSQVDGQVQRRVRGTGLGLPLTRKLSRLLGGDVRVQSTLGRGTSFKVTLPFKASCAPGLSAAETVVLHSSSPSTGSKDDR